jgi:hypothetical protein
MNKNTLVAAQSNLEINGFLNIELDPTLDLFAEIEKMR